MYANIKSYDVSLRCDGETQGEKKFEGKGSTSSKDDVNEHFKFLQRSMVTLTVCLSKGCGPKLFIVAHTIVPTLYLLFQCLVLLLTAYKGNIH